MFGIIITSEVANDSLVIQENQVKFLISVLFFVSSGIALAHGGGLDSSGCHNNHKTGNYHCHRAPSTQKQPVLPPQGTDASKQGQSSRFTQGANPTCYVGPRGGTYTITPNGKKNYDGC